MTHFWIKKIILTQVKRLVIPNKLKVYSGKYSRGHKQDCQNQERLPVSEEDLPSFQYVRLMFMVFNATFNNISVISWRSVLLVEKIGGPGENHRPVASH
jgi:hypothetical protein